MLRHGSRTHHSRGQATVEFALVLIPFLLILMGIVDLGRVVYVSNGTSEAAREIARVTSVHPCDPGDCVIGNSPQTLSTIAVQKGMVMGLSDPSSTIAIHCTDVQNIQLDDGNCQSGSYARVTVTVRIPLMTGFLVKVVGLPQSFTVSSTSHVQLP